MHTSSVHWFPTDTSSQLWDETLSTMELQPFWVTFPTARVSRCQGCLGQICHSRTPPWNIALQHKQQVLFQNPNTGTWQLSRDLRNTYYHVSKNCVVAKYPQFRASQSVKISKTVRQCLLPTHFELIAKEFGIDLYVSLCMSAHDLFHVCYVYIFSLGFMCFNSLFGSVIVLYSLTFCVDQQMANCLPHYVISL